MRDAFCPTCREWTVLVDSGACPWCDTPLQDRRGGWKRPDLAGRRRYNDAQLLVLHRHYMERGASINGLAKRTFAKVGYSSHHSAAVAISAGWKRLRLPARDRIEAVKLACTVHGMAPKHGPRPGYGTYKRRLKQPDQPRCVGVKRQPPGRGERCSAPAMFGSEFCHAHDPSRELQRQAATAAMRRKLPVEPMLPIAPFAAWLCRMALAQGSMREVARRLDAPYTALCAYAKGMGTDKRPKEWMRRCTVERYLGAAGLVVADVYPPPVYDPRLAA